MKLFEAESRLRSITNTIDDIKDGIHLCGDVLSGDSDDVTALLGSLMTEKSRLSFLIDEAKTKNLFDKTSTIKQAEFYKNDLDERIFINNLLMKKIVFGDNEKNTHLSEYIKKTIDLRNVVSKIEEQLLLLSTMVDIDTP